MLEREWHPLATSAEIADIPIARSLLSKRLVLFRDQNGNVTCLQDLCPHRNAPLSLGKIENGRVRCAYHGWEFNSSGQAEKIPSIPEGSRIPKKCVQKFSTYESDGTVWVNLDNSETDKNPTWQSLPDCPYFEIISVIRAPVDLILENFVDCAHTPFVHKGLFRSPGVQQVQADIRQSGRGVCIRTKGEKQQKSLLGKLFFGPQEEVEHIDEFIFPGTVKVDYRWTEEKQIRSISIAVPLDQSSTRVVTRVYIKSKFGKLLLLPILKRITHKILAQDVVVLEAQADAISSNGKPSFSAVASDSPIVWVRRAYEDLVAGKKLDEKEAQVSYQI